MPPPPAVAPPAVAPPPPPVPPAEVADESVVVDEEGESRPVDEADLGFADDEAVAGPWDHQHDEL